MSDQIRWMTGTDNIEPNLSIIVGRCESVTLRIVSTPASVGIITTPECVGVAFQRQLSTAIRTVVRELRRFGKCETPNDVLYILRGGLNFDLHASLSESNYLLPEVSFISSQRVESGAGFSIGENSYSKWNIQDCATLWVGDIVATGITLQTSIAQAIAEYERQAKHCRE